MRFFFRMSVPLSALLLSASLLATPLPGAFQPYQPLKEDGYVQIWNLNFSGQGYHVDLIYMVSNVGPGTLNNGISMLVHTGGRSRSFVREHTDESFRATTGQFGMSNASGELKRTGSRIDAVASFEQARIRMEMQPSRTGMLMPDWKLAENEFFRIGLPVLHGTVVATLEIDGIAVTLTGKGSMDAIVANTLPQKYAKRLFLFRGASGLMQMTGFLDRGGAYQLKLYRQIGAQNREERIVEMTEDQEQVEPFSLYRLSSVLRLTTESGCRYEIRRGEFRGGMYVLESVSPFLRWILKTFFARPFILNYDSTLRLECPGAEPISEKLFASFFLLND